MTRLYLVRHGETPWNVEGRYQGQFDPPLTARGRQQARATADNLVRVGLDALYSSDLARAWQTAEALAEKSGLPIRLDSRLREIDQGEWQGVLIDDIRAGWPQAIEGWERDPWQHHPPGGERLHQLQVRVLAAVKDIVTRYPAGTVAVFTHKLPIALLKVYYEGYPATDIWSLLPANAAWELLEIAPDDTVFPQ